jgi:chemotaxis protein methyltransferase CheR
VTSALPEPLLLSLSKFVASRFGLDFPRFRWPDLEQGVRAAYAEWKNDIGFEAFVHRLLTQGGTDHDLRQLIRHLTVGETYFFREMRSLEAMSERIMPEILRARTQVDRPIRIWCAGCATGEEPYSVAILLNRLFPGVKDLMIVGTDLNQTFLERAAAGVYGEWSFREAPAWLKDGYFESRPGKKWAISPRIKKMVTFRSLNLKEEVYPSPLNDTQDLNLILCRNVLMYFTSSAITEIVSRLHRCLVDGGWLIVGTAEVGCTLSARFDQVVLGDITVYRKQAQRRAMAAGRPATADGQLAEKTTEARSARKNAPVGAAVATRASAQPSELEPQSSYEKALQCYRCGAYQDAERMSLALLLANPDDAAAALLLARICADSGKLREAIEYCERAVAADKMSAAAYYLRALIFEEQGLLDQAIASLTRVTYIDPQFILGHFALGNLTAKHKILGDPSRHYENTLALLVRRAPEEIVPESDGISVGELRRMILQNSPQRVADSGRSSTARSKSRRNQD